MQKQAKTVQRKSMTTNGAFAFASKMVAMIVPFIVYPFIMRVLGAESYGKVTYAESLVSYFALLSTLGIESYAQRECSVMRDNPDGLRKVASRIFALCLIMTTLSFVSYLAIVLFIPAMQSERPLFLIFSLWIIGSGMSMGWLYTAQERFDISSVREIVAKVLYLVLCFTFLKNSNSYFIFGIIVVFTGTVFTMLWNVSGIIRGQCGIVPSLKYSSGFSECIKPIFFLALLTIGSKLFTDFDILMIKWFSSTDSDRAVGLYNSAILLPRALDGILMTVSSVITPRLFIATRQRQEKEVCTLMNKTSNVLFFISVPAILTCWFFSEEMIGLFAGDDFLDAAPVLQIYSLIIIGVLVITLAGTRTYIARQKERKLFCILIVGAVLNITFNYFYIRMWGIVGAALATLSAYAIVMTIELTLEHTWHYIFTLDKLKYVMAGCVVAGIFAIVKYCFNFPSFLRIVVAIGVAGIFYVVVLYFVKESTLMHVIEKMKNAFKMK